LSVGSGRFHSCVGSVCPDELEIRGDAGCSASASCLGVLFGLDTGGELATRLCGGKQEFGFSIVGFPCLCGGVPASPACGVCVSQLVRCAGACSACDRFLVRGGLLAGGLMSRGFRVSRLQAAFRGFYGRCGGLVCPYKLSLGHMLSGVFRSSC
jgi:hypothetical protein